MAVIIRLAVPADRARLLAVALNNKVAAQYPNPITWNNDLIGRYCYGEKIGMPTRCAVITNSGGVTILGWIAGAIWQETDENDNGDGVTINHHKYVSINRFAIDASVTNAQIANNIASLVKQLLNGLNALNVTDVVWPLKTGTIQAQVQSALGNAGNPLPDGLGRRFTGTIAQWIAGFP